MSGPRQGARYNLSDVDSSPPSSLCPTSTNLRQCIKLFPSWTARAFTMKDVGTPCATHPLNSSIYLPMPAKNASGWIIGCWAAHGHASRPYPHRRCLWLEIFYHMWPVGRWFSVKTFRETNCFICGFAVELFLVETPSRWAFLDFCMIMYQSGGWIGGGRSAVLHSPAHTLQPPSFLGRRSK